MKAEEKGTVKLCGVLGCCPTIDFLPDGVEIKDDFGGKVTLNKAQWEDLKNKFSSEKKE